MMDSGHPTLSEELLRILPGVYFRQNAQDGFEHVSGAVAELFGLNPNDFSQGKSPLLAVLHEGDREAYQAGSAECSEQSRRFRIWHAQTGELRTIEERRKPIAASKGSPSGCEGFWINKTDHALLERRLEHAAWKELLSQITRGFAHDFNNALTGIISMGELLGAQASQGHPFREAVALLNQSSARASSLVRRLTQLLHEAPAEAGYVDARILAAEVLDLLQKTAQRHLQVKGQTPGGPLPIHTHAWALRMVLMHLLLNGIEAGANPGTLSFETTREITPPRLAPHAGKLPPPPWICFRIIDEGRGFTVTPAAFELSFTTKATRHGTGLGLLIARRFCAENAAALFFDSGPSQGTTVSLWFHEAEMDGPSTTAEAPRRLLVSATDPAHAREISALCRANGFFAVNCPNPEDVIQLLAANSDQFDALLLAGDPARFRMVLDWVRQQRLRIKTAVVAAAEEIQGADLLINSADQERIPTRLRQLLS